MIDSKIQWTDHTWNVAVGCTKVDEDCKYCYMYRQSLDSTRYDPKTVRKTKGVFTSPLKIGEPSRIFTSSLTDVFHPAIDSYRQEMWDIIRKCPHHTFQILTKRPERILECLPEDWGNNGYPNVWLGTSIGHQKAIVRAWQLVEAPALVHFISFEPMWTPIVWDQTCPAIDWAIIGGESGNDKGKYRYRPCDESWIAALVASLESTVYKPAIFIKQMGTFIAKQKGYKDRHGGDISEWPEHLQIREFPE